MWSYYGAKTNLVGLYPPPKYGTVIEPFAGSARYALKYWDREVILFDSYDAVIKIWHWLQMCSAKDILSLPVLKAGDSIKDIKWDCEGQRLFMGYMVGRGLTRPQFKVSSFVASEKQYHFKFSYKRIAADLPKIKHWRIVKGDYQDAPDIAASWFIDPPYQVGGGNYVKNNKSIDFAQLAQWSQSRQGQVIVCENTKADWMEFTPISKQRGSLYTTTEAFWTNQPSSYHATQQTMF